MSVRPSPLQDFSKSSKRLKDNLISRRYTIQQRVSTVRKALQQNMIEYDRI